MGGRDGASTRGLLLTAAVLVVVLLGACPVQTLAEAASVAVEGPHSQAPARFQEGMALWKSGDREAALAAFEACTEGIGYAAPVGGYESFLKRTGEAWLRGAREDFRVALLGPPDEAEAHFFVGNLFKSRYQWQETIAEYEKTVRLKPGHAQAHYYMGHEWARLHHWNAAVEPLRAAATLTPSDPNPHMLLAIVLGQIGTASSLDEAVREAQEGVRLLPDSPQSHWILGHAYLALVRRDEAAAEFRTYLALEKPGPMTDSGIERANELLRQMAPYLSP